MPRKVADDVARRREAAIAGHRGDAAAARAFLADPAPAVRATALGALARAGGLTPDDLAAGLADPAAIVRARAAELCAARPGDQAPGLAAALADDDPRVVEAAAWASGERVPPEPGIVAAPGHGGHRRTTTRCVARRPWRRWAPSATRPGCPRCWRRPPTAPRCGGGRYWRWPRSRAPRSTRPSHGPSTDRDWQVRQAAEDVGR